jgi:hypothetical protein
VEWSRNGWSKVEQELLEWSGAGWLEWSGAGMVGLEWSGAGLVRVEWSRNCWSGVDQEWLLLLYMHVSVQVLNVNFLLHTVRRFSIPKVNQTKEFRKFSLNI